MERNKALDICKGLGILLVIVGHMETPFGKTIYAFHMGLFFFLSGYCFSDKYLDLFWEFFKKRTWRLMMPYLIFPAIAFFVVPHVEEVWYKMWSSNQLWDSYPYNILGTFWFLKSLYIVSIVSWFIIWLIRKYLPQSPFVAPIVTLGMLYCNGADRYKNYSLSILCGILPDWLFRKVEECPVVYAFTYQNLNCGGLGRGIFNTCRFEFLHRYNHSAYRL